MKKIFQKLKEKAGATYIEAAFVIVTIMWIIALLVGFLPVFSKIQKIHTYSTNAARVISVEGGLTGEALIKIEEYKSKMELNDIVVDYSESDFFDGDKIQLNDEVVVNVQSNYMIKILGFPVEIPIKSKAVARSEVYHKL